MQEWEMMMKTYIDKAKILIEALPYIKEFNGKTVVIKYGGSAMINENIKHTVMEDIALMKLVGMRPVIVHGGGPEINKALQQMGKKSEFVNGLRVTDQETMEIVEMVLAGKLNKSIVQDIQAHGIQAVGLCGKDGNMIKATKMYVDGLDIGYVGEVTEVDTKLLDTLIQNDFIPIIAPVGTDGAEGTYNINADYAALAIAGALKAEKLVFLTDVEGVLEDVNDSSSIISRLSVLKVPEYIESGIIAGGMIPKVQCCVEGVQQGVKTVHIIDGRVEHCLLLEIFTEKGIGTMIEE